MPPQPGAVFEAVIIPHRSLTRAGLRWLVGFICLMSTMISAGLWYIGAWPVIGFNGAEIALALVLLRRNARASRASEMLLLSDEGLRVVRTDMAGRRAERRLQSAWLRAELEERPGRVPAAGWKWVPSWAKLRSATLPPPWPRRCTAIAIPGSTIRNCGPSDASEDARNYVSAGPIDLMSSKTRLRTDGSVMR